MSVVAFLEGRKDFGKADLEKRDILELYRNPEKRQRYGIAAAEKVKQFDAENVHRIMKEIYLSV